MVELDLGNQHVLADELGGLDETAHFAE